MLEAWHHNITCNGLNSENMFGL